MERGGVEEKRGTPSQGERRHRGRGEQGQGWGAFRRRSRGAVPFRGAFGSRSLAFLVRGGRAGEDRRGARRRPEGGGPVERGSVEEKRGTPSQGERRHRGRGEQGQGWGAFRRRSRGAVPFRGAFGSRSLAFLVRGGRAGEDRRGARRRPEGGGPVERGSVEEKRGTPSQGERRHRGRGEQGQGWRAFRCRCHSHGGAVERGGVEEKRGTPSQGERRHRGRGEQGQGWGAFRRRSRGAVPFRGAFGSRSLAFLVRGGRAGEDRRGARRASRGGARAVLLRPRPRGEAERA